MTTNHTLTFLLTQTRRTNQTTRSYRSQPFAAKVFQIGFFVPLPVRPLTISLVSARLFATSAHVFADDRLLKTEK
jgi:hypothetical protein